MEKKVRQSVFDKYGGRCAYCGCELDSKWQVDHAISKLYWFYWNIENPKGVDAFSNLISVKPNIFSIYKIIFEDYAT